MDAHCGSVDVADKEHNELPSNFSKHNAVSIVIVPGSPGPSRKPGEDALKKRTGNKKTRGHRKQTGGGFFI